jgi:signal transduction histidine kinase
MKQKLITLSQRYLKALRLHLQPESRSENLQPAAELGRQAVALGVNTLDMARMHEQALGELNLSPRKGGLSQRAELFFAEVTAPLAGLHHATRQIKHDFKRLQATLSRRTLELAATNRQLKRGVNRRKSVEAALKKSGVHYSGRLKNSLRLQEDLRRFTHQVLAAQEMERKKISLELQNEVAQTLLGINVHLLSLKREARTNTSGLKKDIASAHRLVASSVRSVRRVAHGLGSL